jgi:hypothetical protein
VKVDRVRPTVFFSESAPGTIRMSCSEEMITGPLAAFSALPSIQPPVWSPDRRSAQVSQLPGYTRYSLTPNSSLTDLAGNSMSPTERKRRTVYVWRQWQPVPGSPFVDRNELFLNGALDGESGNQDFALVTENGTTTTVDRGTPYSVTMRTGMANAVPGGGWRAFTSDNSIVVADRCGIGCFTTNSYSAAGYGWTTTGLENYDRYKFSLRSGEKGLCLAWVLPRGNQLAIGTAGLRQLVGFGGLSQPVFSKFSVDGQPQIISNGQLYASYEVNGNVVVDSIRSCRLLKTAIVQVPLAAVVGGLDRRRYKPIDFDTRIGLAYMNSSQVLVVGF